MENRMEQLEYTVMELGTEMYRLRHQIDDLSANHDDLCNTFQDLKKILDQKGMITPEDFDKAIETKKLLEHVETEIESDKNSSDGKKGEFH